MANQQMSAFPRIQHRDFKVCHRKGSTIYRQDEKATAWFEVLSGTVRTSRIRADGERRVTGFFFTGDVIGVAKERRHETAETLTETTLLCHMHPPASAQEPQSESEIPHQRALETAQASLFLLGRSTVIERLSAFLISIAARVGESGQLPLPMNGEDIADYLGMASHTVCRTMKDLERRGIIARPNRSIVRILKPGALLALAGEEWPDESLALPDWRPSISPHLSARPASALHAQKVMS